MGNFFDNLTGKTGAKKAKESFDKAVGLLGFNDPGPDTPVGGTVFEILSKGFAGQEAGLLKALQALNKGYAGAQANLDLVGGQAKQSVLDQQKQQLAGATQHLASTGLYNTTVGPQMLQPAIYGQTNKALLDIDQALAQLQTNLKVGQTQGQVGLLGQLAGIPAQKAGSLADLGSLTAQLYTGQQFQGGFLGDLLKLGGQIGSAALLG